MSQCIMGATDAVGEEGCSMPQRILVVDDEKKIVRLLRAYLEQAGFQVLAAYDGDTAMRIIRHDRPDLIVLDLMLPDRGLAYTLYDDGVLLIRPRLKGENYVMRVYDVTDILLSVEDVTTGGAEERGGAARGEGLRQSGTPSLTGGQVRPQYAGSRAGNNEEEYGFSPITDRAQNLVLLLKQACGQGTWMSPASTGLIDVAEQERD